MTDDAWSNFIASINPAELESERMRVHGDLDHERPGSRWDHEMRHAHEWLKQQRADRQLLQAEDEMTQVKRLQVADADLAIHQQQISNPNNYDEQLEASIEAYRARKKAA